jgi:hypothetical protein
MGSSLHRPSCYIFVSCASASSLRVCSRFGSRAAKLPTRPTCTASFSFIMIKAKIKRSALPLRLPRSASNSELLSQADILFFVDSANLSIQVVARKN